VESNGSLPPGGWLQVICGLPACTPGSAPVPTLGNEYGRTLPLTFIVLYQNLSSEPVQPLVNCWWESTELVLVNADLVINYFDAALLLLLLLQRLRCSACYRLHHVELWWPLPYFCLFSWGKHHLPLTTALRSRFNNRFFTTVHVRRLGVSQQWCMTLVSFHTCMEFGSLLLGCPYSHGYKQGCLQMWDFLSAYSHLALHCITLLIYLGCILHRVCENIVNCLLWHCWHKML